MKHTRLVLATVAIAALAASPAAARKRRIQPYLGIDAGVFSDLGNHGGGTTTYAAVSAGASVAVTTPRSELAADVRYRHQFTLSGGGGDFDSVDGIVRGRHLVTPNFQIEGGALASRLQTNIPGGALSPAIGSARQTTQFVSTYLQPTLLGRVENVDLTAAYRFGYTRLGSRNRRAGFAGFDDFDSSTSHTFTASAGQTVRASALPFGWLVSAGHEREDGRFFDARFRQSYLRADVVVPVSQTLAAVGSAGYEKIRSTQADVARDASGVPVRDANGRFVADPAAPRLLAYDQSGFIWDVGVMWRPSDRTQAEARVGRRYGSTTYSGSISHRIADRLSLQLGAFDGVQTFGRQINGALAALPASFTTSGDSFGGGLSGCVFGSPGAAGAGGCTGTLLQAVAGTTYRARGVNLGISYAGGPTTIGLGAGYLARHIYVPLGGGAASGYDDRSLYLTAYLLRRLSARSGVDARLLASWFDSDQALARGGSTVSLSGSYYRALTERVTGTASLGVFSTRVDGFDAAVTGAAEVGARYAF